MKGLAYARLCCAARCFDPVVRRRRGGDPAVRWTSVALRHEADDWQSRVIHVTHSACPREPERYQELTWEVQVRVEQAMTAPLCMTPPGFPQER